MGSGSQAVILALAVVVNRSGSPDDDDDQEGTAVSVGASPNPLKPRRARPMQLRKVGLKNEEITIVWEDRPLAKSDTTVSHKLTSKDAPSPRFRDAMDGVVVPVLRLLELPEDYGEGMGFRNLPISSKADDRRGFVVSCTKPIAATNAPFNISTPHVATGKGNAKKPQMIRAAMDASGLNLSSDEADAYWVADYLMNAGVDLGEVA